MTYTLRDVAGSTISVGHGTIASGAHFAKFIDQLDQMAPDFVLPSGFQSLTQFASLEITSNEPLSILALRMTTDQRNEVLLTTTPTADLTRPAANGASFFPQFADGGGYTTSLVLLNASNEIETGKVEILDDNGNPFVVYRVGGATGSVFRYSIPSGGFARFQTDGSPATAKTGWAQVTPDAGTSTPIGAGVFSSNPGGVLVTESGIPAVISTTHARIYLDLAKTEKWIDRTLREDARETVGEYLNTRQDSLPWLFISQSPRTKFHMPGPLTRSAAHLVVKKYLAMIYPASLTQGTATRVLRRSIAKLINRKTGRIETAQEWLGHSSTAHTPAYIDAEDYREKANGAVASLDIQLRCVRVSWGRWIKIADIVAGCCRGFTVFCKADQSRIPTPVGIIS